EPAGYAGPGEVLHGGQLGSAWGWKVISCHRRPGHDEHRSVRGRYQGTDRVPAEEVPPGPACASPALLGDGHKGPGLLPPPRALLVLCRDRPDRQHGRGRGGVLPVDPGESTAYRHKIP